MATEEQNDDEFHIINENEFEQVENEIDKINDNDDNDSTNNEDNMLTNPQINHFKQDICKKLQEFEIQSKKNEKEKEMMNNLKKELQSKITEQSKIIEKDQQTLSTVKEQLNEYNQLTTAMKKEIDNMKTLRTSMEEEQRKMKSEREKIQNERKEFEKNRAELKELISKLNKTAEISTRNEEMLSQVNHLLNEQKAMSNDLQIQIKQDSIQQQSTLQSNLVHSLENKEPIVTLDSSQAYSCKNCGTHIALESDIESRCYQVGQGTFTESKRGYLFKNGYNMILGETKIENFTTGAYSISWVSCAQCQQSMGWKYISTDNTQNCSKIGKYCLARYSLLAPQETKEKNVKENNEV